MAQAPKTPKPIQQRASTRRIGAARPALMAAHVAAKPASGKNGRIVYLVDGSRTPFLRAKSTPGPFTPVDLAVQCGRPLLARQSFPPEAFDYVILGCVNVLADEMNPARVAALRLGMGEAMRAFTVQINCGSGMQSIDTGYRLIEGGQAELILAGGAEALSHSPLVFSQKAAAWFGKFATARSPWQKMAALGAFRPDMAKPVIGLERGLTDPITELSMGRTAEIIAHAFGITREQADAYALESHQRLTRAQEDGTFNREIIPAVTREGKLFERDDGVRPDSSLEKLAKLKPVFDRSYGQVTPGNSSQITDGASWVVLASEEAVAHYNLKPIAKIVDSEWAALDPAVMGLGPTICSTALTERLGLTLDDIDLWEINEAFAAQVLACLAAWQDADYCRDVLGLDAPYGVISRDRLNVDGGAVSLGHPVGSSGNRIVLHLANALKQRGLKRGIATECIGGGQGGAMLLEVV